MTPEAPQFRKLHQGSYHDWAGASCWDSVDGRLVDRDPHFVSVEISVRGENGTKTKSVRPPRGIGAFEPDNFIDAMLEKHPGLISYRVTEKSKKDGERRVSARVYVAGRLAEESEIFSMEGIKLLQMTGAVDVIVVDGSLQPLFDGDVLAQQRNPSTHNDKYFMDRVDGPRKVGESREHDYTGGTEEISYWSDGSRGSSHGSVNRSRGTYYFWHGRTDVNGKFSHWVDTNDYEMLVGISK